jgi:hypothetical protein
MIADRIPEFTENTDTVISSDSKIIDGIIVDLRIVIDQLNADVANAKSLILELARRLDETKRCEQSQICKKIKEILQDKIKGGKITKKWIAECLPQQYKRKYSKRELCSLSRSTKSNAAVVEKLMNGDLIAIDPRDEKSILTSINRCNNDNDHSANDGNLDNEDGIEQELDKEVTNQNTGTEVDYKYEELFSENQELKEALRRQTSILTANQISAAEIELAIPNTKYQEIKSAMKSSRDSIYLRFDRSGMLQRVDPDTLRERLRNG